MLQVKFRPESGAEEFDLPLVWVTEGNGHQADSTYQADDGLRARTYHLVFKGIQMGAPIDNTTGLRKDRLKGDSTNPQKSKHTVTVVDSVGGDLGVIELSTIKPVQ